MKEVLTRSHRGLDSVSLLQQWISALCYSPFFEKLSSTIGSSGSKEPPLIPARRLLLLTVYTQGSEPINGINRLQHHILLA